MRRGDLERLALKYFQLELPTTPEKLKSAYRRESLKVHPDQGGSDRDFRRVKRAYDIISSCDIVFSAHTQDIDFSKLGKGLPDGIDCTACAAKGFQSIQMNFVQCAVCRGTGHVTKCINCRGKGCRLCGDVGRISVKSATLDVVHKVERCSNCSGTGGFKPTHVTERYFVCPTCEGNGQLPKPPTEVEKIITTVRGILGI